MGVPKDGTAGGAGLIPWVAERLFGRAGDMRPPVAPDTRRRGRLAHVAAMRPAERVAEAFRAVPPTPAEARVIGALQRRPGGTAAQLTADCGWSGTVWQMHFKLMCQKRAAWLWPSDAPGEADAAFPGAVLAEYRAGDGTFRLRPEIARVFRKLGVGAE